MPIFGLEDEIQAYAEAVVEDASSNLLDSLRDAAPVDTGELVASAYGPELDGLSATIGFSAPQADYTDLGTAAHDIYPVNANKLTFFWQDGFNGPGVYSFAHVFHPGVTGTDWFTDGVEEWETYVQDSIDALGG